MKRRPTSLVSPTFPGNFASVGFSAAALVAFSSWMVLAVNNTLAEETATRTYDNRLRLLDSPAPLLSDYPEFVEPVRELRRYEAPLLVDDSKADLSVRAWRFSYNARGIIEMPNRLCATQTAVIMVHP